MKQLPWRWGSKISEQLLRDGLASVEGLFGGRVLDLGCGSKPYQELLGARAVRWIGLDYGSTYSGRSAADVFGSGLQMPFATATFDTILCTQVLEHVSQPAMLLCEARRVLRPGGHIVATAPQTNPLHEEPRDYFRYTCYGLRALMEGAGLEVDDVRPLGGAIATVGQMVVWHMNWLRRVRVAGALLGDLVNAALSWTTLRLDRLSSVYGGGAMKDTINWLVVARKPAPC
jgi:SAM-dependent methyltransferase